MPREATDNSPRNPRSALWCAVIKQAIEDATLPVSTALTASEQAQARAWLTRPNRDFAEACALADLDPDAVRAFAIGYIAECEGKAKSNTLVSRLGQRPRAHSGGRPPVTITHEGQTKTASEWAELLGISPTAIKDRHRRGLPSHQVLSTDSLRSGNRSRTPRSEALKAA